MEAKIWAPCLKVQFVFGALVRSNNLQRHLIGGMIYSRYTRVREAQKVFDQEHSGALVHTLDGHRSGISSTLVAWLHNKNAENLVSENFG